MSQGIALQPDQRVLRGVSHTCACASKKKKKHMRMRKHGERERERERESFIRSYGPLREKNPHGHAQTHTCACANTKKINANTEGARIRRFALPVHH